MAAAEEHTEHERGCGRGETFTVVGNTSEDDKERRRNGGNAADEGVTHIMARMRMRGCQGCHGRGYDVAVGSSVFTFALFVSSPPSLPTTRGERDSRLS